MLDHRNLGAFPRFPAGRLPPHGRYPPPPEARISVLLEIMRQLADGRCLADTIHTNDQQNGRRGQIRPPAHPSCKIAVIIQSNIALVTAGSVACSLLTLFRRFSTISIVVCTPISAMMSASSSSRTNPRQSSNAPRTPSTPPRMFFLVLSRPGLQLRKKPSSQAFTPLRFLRRCFLCFLCRLLSDSAPSGYLVRQLLLLGHFCRPHHCHRKISPSSVATITSSSARGFSARISPAISLSSSRTASASAASSAVSFLSVRVLEGNLDFRFRRHFLCILPYRISLLRGQSGFPPHPSLHGQPGSS